MLPAFALLPASMTNGDDDIARDLAAWTARRDEAAFARLVERYTGLVTAVCRRRLGAGAAADEAAQATFIVLARRAGSVARAQALDAWLYRVAIGVCRNARRIAERRARHEREAAMREADERQAADAASPWADLRPRLDDAIASLDAGERALVVSHFLDGVTQVAAARRLGISENAAQKRIAAAVRKLRSWFERRGHRVGLGAFVAGLAAEAGPSDPGFAAACTRAALHPAGAANALASGAIGIGAGKLAIAVVAACALVGAAATGALHRPTRGERVLWVDRCEDATRWGPEPFASRRSLAIAVEPTSAHGGERSLRVRYACPHAGDFDRDYASSATPIRIPAGATRLRAWVRVLAADPTSRVFVRLRGADQAWETMIEPSRLAPGWQPIELDLAHPDRCWRRDGEVDERGCPPVDPAVVTHLVLYALGGDVELLVDDIAFLAPADG